MPRKPVKKNDSSVSHPADARRLSLAPLTFQQAIAAALKIKPEPKPQKRRKRKP